MCLDQFIKGELNLPLKRLNVYEKGGKMKYIYPPPPLPPKEIPNLKSKEPYKHVTVHKERCDLCAQAFLKSQISLKA